MAYQRNDNRYGDGDGWRERERGHGNGGGYGAGRGYRGEDRDWRSRSDRGDYDEDRGFFDRAGDEVRSWFGDDEAERRREMDQRRYEREAGYGYGGPSAEWDDGDRYAYGGRGGYGGAWRGGYGEDYARSRRFDRVDVGSTGAHGAHPTSAPAGAGGGYGGYAPGYRSSARAGIAAYGAAYGDRSRRSGGYDRDYEEWRSRQLDQLDRDYDEYRRENQSRFEQEFGAWRERRQGQRRSLALVVEHMEVVGSDGKHVGTVDKVRGDRIILTKSDDKAGGHHHSIPCGWIEEVDKKVTINRTAEEAMRQWRDEETRRALFEPEGAGGDGPHALNRSFSGTY